LFIRLYRCMQHTATHCNTLQHSAHNTHTSAQLRNIGGLVVVVVVVVAVHCNALQHTTTHCNTLQHTPVHNSQIFAGWLCLWSSPSSSGLCVGNALIKFLKSQFHSSFTGPI